MNIERAGLSDIPSLCTLLGVLFSQELEFEPKIELQSRALRMIIESPETGFILVAKESGEILGMVSILFQVSTALGGRVALLEDMVVAEEHRSKGIGGVLLQSALQMASEEGVLRVTLLTDSDNSFAHAFYEKNGFSQSDMQPFRSLLIR